MTTADPHQEIVLLRQQLADAFGTMSATFDMVTAHLFMTRALVDLLDERGLLPTTEVRERALAMVAANGTMRVEVATEIVRMLDPAEPLTAAVLN